MPLNTDFIINIDLQSLRDEKKGLCVFLDQWTLSLAFKQNIHVELTRMLSLVLGSRPKIFLFHPLREFHGSVSRKFWSGLCRVLSSVGRSQP